MSTLDAKAAASEGATGEPMKYKTVPAMPDLAFSAVGFGCWGISGGSTWNGSTDEESIRTVRTAVDLGITYFDVAPVYGFGHAEEVLGEALARRRDSVLIGSKCGLLWDDSGAIRNDLSSASIGKEIDESLRRLNTDHLDLYQMHWPDIATPIEESMEALERVVAAGKVRYIGVTNFSVERTDACRAIGPVAAHQGLYNMLEHNPTSYHEIPLEYRTRSEILPMVMREGMAFSRTARSSRGYSRTPSAGPGTSTRTMCGQPTQSSTGRPSTPTTRPRSGCVAWPVNSAARSTSCL